ncbi:MAG TPA: MFS transporter [Thermohalobaculum sp.]|nr:MFS transporter [Thermohalobaculum sp.]
MSASAGRAALTAQIAPIAAITLFGVTMAMSYPLFGLVLERAGTSGTMIGLNTTAAAVAMVAGAPILPPVLRRFGLGPLMIVAALALAATILAIPLVESFWYWTFLRFLFGVAGTVLFFASEYWIVAAAPELSRGRIIAVYALSVSAGFALGPAILGLTGLEGMLPFAVGAGVVLAGLGPIVAGLATAPEIADDDRPSPFAALKVFVTDPGVVFAVVLFGTIEFGAMALIAVWGVRSGLPEAQAALLLTAFALGCMVLQIPLGWAADRLDRRMVLSVIAAGSALAPIGMILAGSSFAWMAFFVGLWGALSVGLYTIALTELGARYRGSRLAVGNAAIILGYGIGALVSPALLGWAMDSVVPPDGLMLASAMLALGYLALVAARLGRRRSPLTGDGG